MHLCQRTGVGQPNALPTDVESQIDLVATHPSHAKAAHEKTSAVPLTAAASYASQTYAPSQVAVCEYSPRARAVLTAISAWIAMRRR